MRADADSVRAGFIGQIVALNCGVILVGGGQGVSLPFGVGIHRRSAPDGLHEGGIIGEQFGDLVAQILANANARDILDGIGRNSHFE